MVSLSCSYSTSAVIPVRLGSVAAYQSCLPPSETIVRLGPNVSN